MCSNATSCSATRAHRAALARKEYDKVLGIVLVKFWLEVSQVDFTTAVVSSP
jgi:hypothetical protein